jgi:hypothetical protein
MPVAFRTSEPGSIDYRTTSMAERGYRARFGETAQLADSSRRTHRVTIGVLPFHDLPLRWDHLTRRTMPSAVRPGQSGGRDRLWLTAPLCQSVVSRRKLPTHERSKPMLIADYGPWSDFASGRTPESYIEDALGGDPGGYDLYAASAAFRRAVLTPPLGGAAVPGRLPFRHGTQADLAGYGRRTQGGRRTAALSWCLRGPARPESRDLGLPWRDLHPDSPADRGAYSAARWTICGAAGADREGAGPNDDR